jgi:hypothetical protein
MAWQQWLSSMNELALVEELKPRRADEIRDRNVPNSDSDIEQHAQGEYVCL